MPARKGDKLCSNVANKNYLLYIDFPQGNSTCSRNAGQHFFGQHFFGFLALFTDLDSESRRATFPLQSAVLGELLGPRNVQGHDFVDLCGIIG